MITNYCSAKFGNVILEIYQIFRLLVCCHIIEVDVFVSPLKVMNNAFISQLFLNDENVLEEVDDPLLDVKMVKFCNHSFLIFQISFVLVDQSISLIDHISDIVENCAISAHVKLS